MASLLVVAKSKEKWNSKELIKLIKSESKKQIKITFCHIGGYECLKDGTKTEICRSLGDIQEFLNDFDIEYDETITDPNELADSVEEEWSEIWDDGGGSGWIEYN